MTNPVTLLQEMHDAVRAALRRSGGIVPDHIITAMAVAVSDIAADRQADVAKAVEQVLRQTPTNDPGHHAVQRAHRAAVVACGLSAHTVVDTNSTGWTGFSTARDKTLYANHSIVEAQYSWLLARQGYHCALCPNTQARKDRAWLSVDHDHRCCPVGPAADAFAASCAPAAILGSACSGRKAARHTTQRRRWPSSRKAAPSSNVTSRAGWKRPSATFAAVP